MFNVHSVVSYAPCYDALLVQCVCVWGGGHQAQLLSKYLFAFHVVSFLAGNMLILTNFYYKSCNTYQKNNGE